MGTNVTRRGFVKLATDALWALPTVAGGVLAAAPTEALADDMSLAIRYECRGDLYEFPLALQLEEAVFDEPTEVKDIIAKPLDTYFTEGVDVGLTNNLLLPNDLPLCGGVFQMWLPEFPVSIFCDPSGYVQLTMKSPSFGYKNDFGGSEDNGWQCFPRQSAKEQCEELISGWQKALSDTSAASSRASGVLSHAKFSPKLTATVNLQFMAIANWNMEQKYFQGDAVFQVLLSMTISLTEQFFAGPIPMYINFTFIGQAMANYGAGFTVPLPEGDKHPNLVHVISAIDKYQWDYTNTGLSFQFLIKPSLSVGVGVKGVASVCLKGEIKLTYFIGVTYRGKLDKKKYPLPHRIATYSFKAEVVIEFLLFTRRWTLWQKKNDNWFNNWDKGASAQGEEEVVAQAHGGESLDEFLANMNPVSDAMLPNEAEQQDVYVTLASSTLQAEGLSSSERSLVQARLSALGAQAGVWFDLSLAKRVGEEQAEPSAISSTDQPLKLEVAVPESLRSSGAGLARTYYVLRLHDGAVDVLASGAGQALDFESDRYSTYVMAYTGPNIGGAPEQGGQGTQATTEFTTVTSSGTSRQSSPGTGDSTPGVALIVIAGLACLTLGWQRRKQRRYPI